MDKKNRLLVIDDSEETVAGLEHFFSKKYEVFTAADGMEGLKLFEMEKEGFDLVITDLVMPFISGVGVISIIKKKYPGTPVIAITGWGEHPGALATEAQADVVLEKPIELPELDCRSPREPGANILGTASARAPRSAWPQRPCGHRQVCEHSSSRRNVGSMACNNSSSRPVS